MYFQKCFEGVLDCVHTNNGATDIDGDDCSYYDSYPADCGEYDDNHFIANIMCCGCKTAEDNGKSTMNKKEN